MNEWISVETPPEDGTIVDVWQGGIFNWRSIDVYYLEDISHDDTEGFYSTECYDGKLSDVTHYMIITPPQGDE